MKGRSRLPLLALLAVVLALNLWCLMRFPPPFVDEAWFAGRAWSFLQTSRAFGPLDAGVFDRFEGHWTFFPWLPTLLQSLALRLFNEPALFALRIVSLFFGFLLLVAVYSIGNRLYGRRLGLLGVLLVSLSFPFLYSAHLARYDIMAAAFGLIAIALYLSNPRSHVAISLISGLCIGLAFETHAHGAIYGPTLVTLYFFHFRWSMFRRRDFWGFMVGVGFGLVFYVLLHIARYPGTYLALIQLTYTTTHTPPILTLDPQVILQALSDMGLLLVSIYLTTIPIIVWAAVSLAKRGTESDKTLLVMNGALVAGVLLLIRNKFTYYAILFAPAIDLMLAEFFLSMFQRWRGRLWDYARLALILGLFTSAVLVNLSRFQPWTNSWQYYQEAQDYIKQTIQPGESIMGSQTYWFGLYDRAYYSWEQLIYYQRYAPGSTLEDALREFQPDILIIDPHMTSFISDEAGTSTYSQYLRVPRSELEAFLSSNATLVGQREMEHYGRIYLYRIGWQEEQSMVQCLPQENLADTPRHVPTGR